ncbi:uncharacterized protein LOC131009682 [Salvia miltiorrhiza]|uniref:uncharacterized protein LOC131009682 n=1 Tax=Salvia miltiorrhiza TaxID=226208 RepID=UPI0025AC4CCE|nr:uncharacterized protein LOC131009682 [Salvia miltiorrhiza]
MGEWIDGVWVWSLNWIRGLRARDEEQVSYLKTHINNFALVAGRNDEWKWKANSNGVFTVKTAYRAIRKAAALNETGGKKFEFSLIWNTPAAHKAKTTAWRVLMGRMATIENLLKRNVIIPTQDISCVLCQEKTEDSNHLFFSCQKTTEVWYDLLLWIGKSAALHSSASNHLMGFCNIGHKKDILFLTGIWICTVWCIWKKRNEVRFNHGEQRKIHWVSWEQICMPLAEGGLGIRLFSEVVRVFSFKFWWRFQAKESLWAK